MGTTLSTVQEYITPIADSLRPYLPNASYKDTRTILIFSSALLLGYLALGGRWRRLPPGPPALPIVGNMLQFAGIKDPYKYLLTLRERYGDIVRLKVGPMTMFVVFGPKLIRETMLDQGNYIANRPNWIYIIEKVFHKRGVFWSNGESWRNLRKFTVSTLRDFGVGKKSLEERILEECGILATVWEKQGGVSFDIKPLLADAVSNIMCSIVFGERFEYTDPEFKQLLGYLEYLFNNAGLQVPENFFPWIAFFRRQAPAATLVENDLKIQAFVHRKVQEHRVTFDPNQIRDFVDLFLKTEQEGNEKVVSLDDVFRVTVDLFLAGSEATSTVLYWLFLYLVRYPDVQQRCYEEIMKVVGSGRSVSLSDKPKMTYVMATLNEVLRHGSIAPFAPPHAVTSPIKIGGYQMEPNDILLFHLYSSHMDPGYWDQPQEFQPDRWLDSSGQVLKKNQALLPFGIGPRTCLGEPLVHMETFLFATNMLQRFHFKSPSGPPPSVEGFQDGITRRPKPYRVHAVPRS